MREDGKPALSIMRRVSDVLSVFFAVALLCGSAYMLWTGSYVAGAHIGLLASATIVAEFIFRLQTKSKAILICGLLAVWLQPVMLFSLVAWNVFGPYPPVTFYAAVVAVWIVPILLLFAMPKGTPR
jgi:hypothetical protein